MNMVEKNLIKKNCPYCEKIIRGYTHKQNDNMILNHIVSKHSSKIAKYIYNKSVEEKIVIDKLLLIVKPKIKEYIGDQHNLLKLKLRKDYFYQNENVFDDETWNKFLEDLKKYYMETKK